MGAAGGREAALCSCLLCCWNSALSANPFNSRPAVFVWVDEQAPDKWLDSVHAITPVSGLCIELSYSLLWLIYLLPFGEFPSNTVCTNVSSAKHAMHCIYMWHAVGCTVHPMLVKQNFYWHNFTFLFVGLFYFLCWCTYFLVPSLISQRGAMCAGGLW